MTVGSSSYDCAWMKQWAQIGTQHRIIQYVSSPVPHQHLINALAIYSTMLLRPTRLVVPVGRLGLTGAAEVDTQLSAVDLLVVENVLGSLSTGDVDEVGVAETSGLA